MLLAVSSLFALDSHLTEVRIKSIEQAGAPRYFDRQVLLSTLQRIEITAAEESNAVTLRATPEESAIRINSSSKEKGEAEERVRLGKVPSAPIEISFGMARYADAWKDSAVSPTLQWVLGHERFDVSPGMLVGPVSTAEGRFSVDIRLDESQARRLAAATAIGLAVRHDVRRYEFEVDTGNGRDAIRQFLDFCRTHAAAH